ncbi:hypothetical protein VTN77DRAFT_8147 [Rasamsonia byssochlamydoides]|uniref:uncharacterized protein n=1 Tax=Rasamsonia byssochlamydoides TaxID=89139 RepID=UPI003742576D
MGPVLYNPFSDGPTMVLSPPQDHASFQFPSQPTFDTASQSLQTYANTDSSPLSMDGVHPTSSKSMTGHSSSWTPASSANPIFTNPSRKRSREESAVAADDDTNGQQSSGLALSKPVSAPEEEPVYGEGMVLLNPRTGLAISAESQTGTWYEELAEQQAAAAPPVSSRSHRLHDANGSAAPSRKSQRLDTSAPGLDDIALASIRQRLQRTSNDDDYSRSLSKTSSSIIPEEPRVDDVTRLLGISWQRVSHDDDMAPAVYGWEKYINNHFGRYLHSARILLENRSMNAYLVAAQSTMQPPQAANAFAHNSTAAPSPFDLDPSTCFYLFKEDLTEAQLVGSTWDLCLQNLRSVPIRFEGTEILKAAERTPERVIRDKGVPVNCVVGNGIPIARVSKEDRVIVGGNGDLIDDMAMGTGMRMDLDL